MTTIRPDIGQTTTTKCIDLLLSAIFSQIQFFLVSKSRLSVRLIGGLLNRVFTVFWMFEYVSKLIDLSWPNFSSITWNATNADCRLADHNEVNIVVECSNRFPIPNLDF